MEGRPLQVLIQRPLAKADLRSAATGRPLQVLIQSRSIRMPTFGRPLQVVIIADLRSATTGRPLQVRRRFASHPGPVGETPFTMEWLRFDAIERNYGARTILAGAAGVLRDGDKIGLVGANGSGKSTL